MPPLTRRWCCWQNPFFSDSHIPLFVQDDSTHRAPTVSQGLVLCPLHMPTPWEGASSPCGPEEARSCPEPPAKPEGGTGTWFPVSAALGFPFCRHGEVSGSVMVTAFSSLCVTLCLLTVAQGLFSPTSGSSSASCCLSPAPVGLFLRFPRNVFSCSLHNSSSQTQVRSLFSFGSP